MNSREYYSQIEAVIKDCPIISNFLIDFDEIDFSTCYLKGKLELTDGSVLYFIEFIEIRGDAINYLKYKYQWQSKNDDLITRWDNVPHHRKIDTFPYHMHDKEGVHASPSINLLNILDIILNKLLKE